MLLSLNMEYVWWETFWLHKDNTFACSTRICVNSIFKNVFSVNKMAPLQKVSAIQHWPESLQGPSVLVCVHDKLLWVRKVWTTPRTLYVQVQYKTVAIWMNTVLPPHLIGWINMVGKVNNCLIKCCFSSNEFLLAMHVI